MTEGYLSNHFLVSMPQLEDQNFSRTVNLICQHDENGALGVVINRLSPHTLIDVFSQLGISVADQTAAAAPVFEGGPVHKEFGLVVHSNESGREWESTLKISDQLSLTSSKDILVDIAQGLGPENAIMSLGYAGWGPGQLEQEIMQNAWFSTPVELGILFDASIDQKWVLAADLIGMDYSKLTTQVGHA
ncbi:MAG: YqgE/AlgH family protein [bacterium]